MGPVPQEIEPTEKLIEAISDLMAPCIKSLLKQRPHSLRLTALLFDYRKEGRRQVAHPVFEISFRRPDGDTLNTIACAGNDFLRPQDVKFSPGLKTAKVNWASEPKGYDVYEPRKVAFSEGFGFLFLSDNMKGFPPDEGCVTLSSPAHLEDRWAFQRGLELRRALFEFVDLLGDGRCARPKVLDSLYSKLALAAGKEPKGSS